MTGWSLNEVKTYASLLGINFNINGYGYVKEQSISPGTSINSDMDITVTLDKGK